MVTDAVVTIKLDPEQAEAVLDAVGRQKASALGRAKRTTRASSQRTHWRTFDRLDEAQLAISYGIKRGSQ